MKHGRNYNGLAKDIDRAKSYSLSEAVGLLKEGAFEKFDATFDAAVKLSVKKGTSIRDTITLPHQFGAKKRVLVFVDGEEGQKQALDGGAAYAGGAELVGRVKGGWIDFDMCLATPGMMKEVGKLGPILGRRGMMPNPRSGTVTNNIPEALKDLMGGRVEFRADKGGVVHLSFGKKSMETGALVENVTVLFQEIQKRRPADHKGVFVISGFISTTMSPGVRVDMGELA